MSETDNPVLNDFAFCTGMAIGAHPPSIPCERHPPSFNSNNISAHSTNQKRRNDPVNDVAGFHRTVEQQYLDELFGRCSVTISPSRRGPESIMGGSEHSGLTSLSQGSRSQQGARFNPQNLKVMLELHAP